MTEGGHWDKRFDDFEKADQAAKDKKGILYVLENGQTNLGVNDDNHITGGSLIKDYSLPC